MKILLACLTLLALTGCAQNPVSGQQNFVMMSEAQEVSAGRDASGNQGVVRNNKFMHTNLGLALRFPLGWRVQNLPDKLLAFSPQADAVIQLKMDEQSSGTPTDYAHRMVGFGSDNRIEALDISGLPAAIATMPAAMAGVIYLNRSTYIIQCNTISRAAFASHRNDMLDTIHSFHALSETERRQARPLVIGLITARTGDTYANLAQHSPLGKTAENYLRLINGNYPQGESVPDQYVKIVE